MKKFCVLSGILLLAACGGEADLSEKALRDSLNQMETKLCVPFKLGVADRLAGESEKQTQFGESEIKLLKRFGDGKRANEHASKQMEMLVRAGLYKAEKEQRVDDGDKKARYAVYSLTERGKEEIGYVNSEALLCLGKQKVAKIKYFTEPTPNKEGLVLTHVVYEAKLQPEKWASSLVKENKEYEEKFAKNLVRTDILVKTNDGWRDLDELKANFQPNKD